MKISINVYIYIYPYLLYSIGMYQLRLFRYVYTSLKHICPCKTHRPGNSNPAWQITTGRVNHTRPSKSCIVNVWRHRLLAQECFNFLVAYYSAGWHLLVQAPIQCKNTVVGFAVVIQPKKIISGAVEDVAMSFVALASTTADQLFL